MSDTRTQESSKALRLLRYITRNTWIMILMFTIACVTTALGLALPMKPLVIVGGGAFLGATFHICIFLSYEAIMRWSRYRLSQQHPFFNILISIIAFAAPFLVVLRPTYVMVLTFAFALNIYSHYVSPGKEAEKWESQGITKPYLIPVIQLAVFWTGLFGYLGAMMFFRT